MKKKSQDLIAIEKKQNVWTIDYKKLNALYEDFVPQEEFSAEQKYFLSSFISSEDSSKASSSSLSSETKPTVTPMPSENLMLVDLNQIENDFKTLFELTRTQTQGEIIELIENVNQKTYAYANVHAQNQDILITISELLAKLKNVEKGLRAISSVRRPSNRDSSFKNSFLSNTTNSSKKVDVFDRFSVKIVQSKSLDTTPVVSKTKIVAVAPLSAKHKVVQIVPWIVDSGCSNHMTGDRSLLKNFVEKFMGTVRFGNDHFAAIIGFGDYV
ncbi:hypothetical protein Tco_1444019 [Tanacetum coccineum]